MANTQQSSSHGKLTAVIAVAAVVIVLALLSAFIWPGWALNKTTTPTSAPTSSATSNGKKSAAAKAPSTPTISAKPLPTDSTSLLKAMPDSVVNYARTDANPSANWTSASPLEEYTMTYSTGDDTKNIALITAQWSSADDAKKQYQALTASLTGDEIASGNVKVSGKTTGSYVIRKDASDSKKAVAVWINDTAVFQANGPSDAVTTFCQKFPL
ncbi:MULTISPECIES: hypothetical protein [Bifidobacterium]|uniref:hypothetical protein n=1 Tax=Bifidobacterium TaxID=1678 RepID=UPI003996C208